MQSDTYQELLPVGELDDLIFQNKHYFEMSQVDLEKLRDSTLRQAIQFHWSNNSAYQNYCQSFNFSPHGELDFEKVPLIPSGSFKRGDVCSVALDDIVKRCESSGTKGTVSKVYRDDTTLNRFLGSVSGTIEQMLHIDDAYCFNLGPDSDEDPHLWFAYAMSAVALLFPTTHCVQQGKTNFDLLYSEYAWAAENHKNVVVVGAPIILLTLLNDMKNRGLTFSNSERLVVVTAGGWKRFEGEALDRVGLGAAVEERFPGLQRGNMRDVLNLVELNTLLAECEERWMHVPPWVLVRIVNPQTLKDATRGTEGIIAYLDASPTSYPGFILSDDIGVQGSGGVCECGRTGQRIRIIRRVISEESRGCALKLDRDYSL